MNRLIFIILLSITQITFGATVLNNDEENYKNPYVVSTSFKKDSIGLIIEDFFYLEKKLNNQHKFYYYSIDRNDMHTTKLTSEIFYSIYPSAPKEINLKFQDIIENKRTFSINKNETLHLHESKIKEKDGYKTIFNLKNKEFKITNKFPNYRKESDIPIAKVIGDQVWYSEFTYLTEDEVENAKYRSSLGINIVNLKTMKFESFPEGYNPFRGTWISLIEQDIVANLIWLGSNYGFYGLDSNHSEKITCFYILEKGIVLKDLKCTKADYITELKKNQGPLLLQQEKNLKAGKVKPEYISEVDAEFLGDVPKLKKQKP